MTAAILSLTDILLANIAVLIGATLQGSIGFGLGFVGAPLLMLISSTFIPAPLLCTAVVLTVLIAHREREGIGITEIKWAIVGRLLGVTAAAAVLASISTEGLALMLGVLILALVGLSVSGLHFRPTTVSLLVAGCVSGFGGTVASVGAPPMAIVYQHASGPKIRGTLSAFFVIGTIMSLAALLVVGRLGLSELLTGAKIMPGLLLGFAVSRRITPFVDRGYTRYAVLGFSAIGGLALVLRELL